MSNIHLNPRKAKPSWLQAPCSLCEKWEEDERPLDPTTKALWNNQGIPDGVRCRYHPLFCDPSDRDKCPYKEKMGKTLVGLYCDFCGKEFELLEPDDPRLEEAIRNPHKIDMCPECQKKKDKNLQQKRIITVLTNKPEITKE